MNAHRLLNWTLAAAMAAVLSTSYLLDGPEDHSSETASSLALEDALKAEARQERFDKAARSICGENAGWRITTNNQLVCLTKRGHKTTKTAQL